MKQYSLYFTCALLAAAAVVKSSPVAFSQSQTTQQEKSTAAAESAIRSQGDASLMGSTPTLRGINNQPNTGNVSAAPGADAMMTQDLLLVNPNKNGQTPQPLQSFVGQTLKISVDPSKVNLRHLSGVIITVINDTSRPLVIDGDSGKAIIGNQTYQAVSLQTLQKKVLPSKSLKAQTGRLLIQVPPAAVTVGATPTIEDYLRMKKPIRKRYGSDQKRRTAEAARFGERILWPHQETQGILYFETNDDLSAAKVQIPIHTLFDAPDKAILEGS